MSDMLTQTDLALLVASWNLRQRARERTIERAIALRYGVRDVIEEGGVRWFRVIVSGMGEGDVAASADTAWNGKKAHVISYRRLGFSIWREFTGPTAANMPTPAGSL